MAGIPASDPRHALVRLLDDYAPEDLHERKMHALLRDFVRETPDCFERRHPGGHITASAWVIDPGGSQALLTHHRKLDKWLQPGGHADGDPDALAVALREVREESGLEKLRPVGSGIFDVDVHRIPARKSEPEHYHYDVRFLVEADPSEPMRPNDESHEMSWLPLDRVVEWTTEESVLRMVRKTRRRQR